MATGIIVGGSVRRFRTSCIFLSISFLSTCQPAPHRSPPIAPCAAPVVARGGWQLIERDGFSFQLPPRFHSPKQQEMGIDSWVESFVTSNRREYLSFDYGQWSGSIPPDSDAFTDYSACAESINGHPATIVTLRVRDSRMVALRGAYVAAASWRSPIVPGYHLTIWAQARDGHVLADYLTVLRTVRFGSSSDSTK
jgi:hypothetical protein